MRAAGPGRPRRQWHRFHRTSAGLTLATLLLASAACRPTAPRSWRLVDLAAVEPEVDFITAPANGPGWSRRSGTLGQSGLTVPAGGVSVVAQSAGTRLSWQLRLGDEPSLRVVPLGSEPSAAACGYRIELDDGGEATVLKEEAIVVPRPTAVPFEIGLQAWARHRVTLAFVVTVGVEGQPCELLWGSPTVAFRAPARRPGSLDPARPNVLLVTADTLRADAVGPWRKGTTITPALDRLADESDVWVEAFTSFNATNPSFASLMTGLYGKDHRVYDLTTPVPAGVTTMAELFHRNGYQAEAVIAASHLTPRLSRGFDRVLGPESHFAAEAAVETAIAWIDAQRDPFFLWLHLFDPHTPHTPPDPFARGLRADRPSGLDPVGSWKPFRSAGAVTYAHRRLGGHTALYEGEVAYVDRQLDRLLGFVESRGLLDTTLVAFVSDHGENLEDHGVRFRHAGLWDTTVHVPLMIRWPGPPRPGRRLSGLVQHLDLFPTLLGTAGIALPDQDGIDLKRLAARSPAGRPMVFAEHAGGRGAMVRTRTHKYFEIGEQPIVPAGVYLYDLETDPFELDNLAGTGLAVEGELAAMLAAWSEDRRAAPEHMTTVVDEEERQRLEALGYH